MNTTRLKKIPAQQTLYKSEIRFCDIHFTPHVYASLSPARGSTKNRTKLATFVCPKHDLTGGKAIFRGFFMNVPQKKLEISLHTLLEYFEEAYT